MANWNYEQNLCIISHCHSQKYEISALFQLVWPENCIEAYLWVYFHPGIYVLEISYRLYIAKRKYVYCVDILENKLYTLIKICWACSFYLYFWSIKQAGFHLLWFTSGSLLHSLFIMSINVWLWVTLLGPTTQFHKHSSMDFWW